MAHTKSGGSTQLGRDSEAKRLGVKLSDGSFVQAGNIIIKQRGTHWYPGKNVKKGADDSLYALIEGTVKFTEKFKTDFTGKKKKVKVVNVI